MHEAALATCAERLDRVSLTLRVLLSATALLVLFVGASFAWAPDMAGSLLVAAFICGVAAAWANDVRVEYLERLAVDRDAYRLPAVRRFGDRLTAQAERRRLAAGLLCAVERAGGHFALTAPDRLNACASELCDVAEQLRDGRTRVSPTSAATCRRLLGRAAESPLYNEDLPFEDLTAALYRIRDGITQA